MPTRKIRENTLDAICRDPGHYPPMHMAYKPGALVEHECPSCHQKQIFVVNRPIHCE